MDTLPPVRNHADVPSHRQGSDGAAFGQLLRRARERCGLTLEHIAHETNIPERHLHALEQGNLSVVPSGIYQRAEIRAFAKTVGLDQNLAIAQFERALESSSEAAVLAVQPVDEETRPRALAAIGIMSLTIAAISIVAMWTQTIAPQASGRPVLAVTFVTSEHPARFARAPKQFAGHINQAPPAPAAVDGQLIVTTAPEGARVTVNGMGWGVTPLTIRRLPFGDQNIRVTKDGYESAERRVSLAENRAAQKIHVSLRVRQ